MLKKILDNSIIDMQTDSKIIRLTFLTSFFHSLIVSLLLILNLNNIFSKNFENGLYIGKVAEYFVKEVNKGHFVNIIIFLTIIFFLTYSIIYPIGQSAIIHYLNDKQKSIKNALRKGWSDFFPMFEFGAVSLVLSPVAFILTWIKLVVLNATTSLFVIWVLIIWFIFMNIANTLKVYTRYFVTIDKMPLYESLKESFKLCFANVKETMKYVRMQTILLINFSINLIVILGVPFVFIYLTISLDIINYSIIKFLVYIIFLLMVLAGAYISSIIRAFFAYYWYKIYLGIRK